MFRLLAALVRAEVVPSSKVVNFFIESSARKDSAAFRADVSRLMDLLSRGIVDPVVTTMPLALATDAHRGLEAHEVVGKLVLVPRAWGRGCEADRSWSCVEVEVESAVVVPDGEVGPALRPQLADVVELVPDGRNTVQEGQTAAVATTRGRQLRHALADAPDVGLTTAFSAASAATVAIGAVGDGAAFLHCGINQGTEWQTPLVLGGNPIST